MIPDGIVRAEVDGDGRLLSCDPALAALQRAAGGSAMGPVVVPQLARIVRQVIDSEIPIGEDVIAVAPEGMVQIMARCVPTFPGAQIELSDWHSIAPFAPRGHATAQDIESAAHPDSMAFHLDERLAIVSIGIDAATARGWHGRPVSELFRLQPDDDGFFPMLRALAEEEPFEGQDAIASVGPAREVVLSGEPLRDATGIFMGYRGSAVIAESARQARDALKNVPREVTAGDFSRRIDAAMRRPLGRIMANAESISAQLAGPVSDDYANYASDIATAARHLMGLVDDLADLQAIERPEFEPAREIVDLADIGRRAAGLLTVKASERDITLHAPETDEGIVAIAEFRRVLQILLNLVGNAIRYSPEGSMVWICVDQEGDEARITVADQGTGLNHDQKGRLFAKFERLGRTDPGGSGLGLYIARRLARAMGGDIDVDSAPGQGARFTLTLPSGD